MRSAYDLESDRDVDWLLRAACRGYPPQWWELAGASDVDRAACNEEARQICRTCPVSAKCLDRAQRLGSVGLIVAGRARNFRRPEARGHGRQLGPRECVRCTTPYSTADPRRIYCTERCRMDANNDRRTMRRVMA